MLLHYRSKSFPNCLTFQHNLCMNLTYLNLSLDKCMWILSKMPNANAYIDYWLNGNVSFVRFLLKPHCTISFMCTDFLEFYKMDTYIYMEITKDTRSTYFLSNYYFMFHTLWQTVLNICCVNKWPQLAPTA